MKQSEFNIVKSSGDTTYVYNTYTGGVIALNKHYSSLLDNQSEWNQDEEFLNNMTKGGFIIEDSIDERDAIRRFSEMSRNDDSRYSFTIAPTLACNFRCPYCYEEGHRYNTMDNECIAKTIEYINSKMEKSGAQSLNITWYGGEPLLVPHIIETITNGIKNDNIKYSAGIITNGYLLTEDVAKQLANLGVAHAQITVDGPPDIHNARRATPNGKGSFEQILSNIQTASEYLQIVIRVNIDKSNANRIDEVFDHLDRFELKSKVRLYVAQVDNINGSCSDEVCLADNEFSEFEVAFLKKHIDRGYTYAYLPAFNPVICGAVMKNAELIDPLGYLYKCWNDVGIIERSHGSIFETATNANIDKWQDYDFEFYEECRDCVFLPTCMGGCPHRNVVDHRKSCRSVKENYREMIEVVNEYKHHAQINSRREE